MDKSSSKPRIESTPKKQQSSGGARASKLSATNAEISKLSAELTRLADHFEDCEFMIVSTLITRECLIKNVHVLIEALENAMIYYDYTEKARKNLEEERDAASRELRESNLEASREEELQKMIENLAEVQEDLGRTKRGAEMCHNKCLQFETCWNELKDANETLHAKLCRQLVKIDHSRRVTEAKYLQLLVKKAAYERGG